MSITLQHMSKICSTFSSQLITPNTSSILIVFRQFFTWTTLGDVDLCFSLMLVTKVNAVEEEINELRDHIINIIHPYMLLAV